AARGSRAGLGDRPVSAFRLAVILAVVAVATLGEGGAQAPALLTIHLVLGIGCAIVLIAGRRSGFAPSPLPTWTFLAFGALAAGGPLLALYAYAAWLVLVGILGFGALAGMSAGAPGGLARLLPGAMALLATGHAASAVIERLSGAARPASTFLNPNHL